MAEAPFIRVEDVEGHCPYEVKKFDGKLDVGEVGERGKGKFIFFFGKRGSGKSVAMRYMMYQNRSQFWTGVAMSAVANTWRDYENYFPKSMVYEDVSLDAIQRIWDVSSKYQGMTHTEVHPRTGAKVAFPMELANILIAIDDGSDKKNALKNEQMQTLAKKGRHNCITYMLATQAFIAVPSGQREAANLILVGSAPNSDARQRLYKYFFKAVFDRFPEFNAFMDEYTTDHRFIVFNSDVENSPEKCMSVFDPVYNVEPFRIGHRDMWVRDMLFRKRSVGTSMSVVLHELDGGTVTDFAAIDKLTLREASALARRDASSIMIGGHIHNHAEGDDAYIFCQACSDEKKSKKGKGNKAQQAENLQRHLQMKEKEKAARRNTEQKAKTKNVVETKVEEDNVRASHVAKSSSRLDTGAQLALLSAFRAPVSRKRDQHNKKRSKVIRSGTPARLPSMSLPMNGYSHQNRRTFHDARRKEVSRSREKAVPRSVHVSQFSVL